MRQADLDVSQQAVLQLLAAGVVSVQAETRCLPHGCLLVETALELLHCGGSVEAHHLSAGTETTVTAGLKDIVLACCWSSELIRLSECEREVQTRLSRTMWDYQFKSSLHYFELNASVLYCLCGKLKMVDDHFTSSAHRSILRP